MGRVWRARDRRLGREVALKEPKGGPDGSAARRLLREAEVLQRLDHPGIVALLDQGRWPDGRPYLVLRRVEGRPLSEWAAQGERSVEQRAWTFRGVVAAVAHAHAQGVVHRDLSPGNVRVAEDGTICVLDWGLARVLDEPARPERAGPALTRVGARVGTPAYMSPEQAAGEVVGPEADVWSLGVLFWELLAGRRAYAGRAATEVLAGVLSGPPPLLAEVAPAVPAALQEVVGAALSPLASRPQDAVQMIVLVDEALSLSDAPVPAPRRSRLPALAAAVGVAAVSTAFAGLIVWDEPPASGDSELVAALLDAGQAERARAAACALLQSSPGDPVARGALLADVPPPTRLWEVAAPRCSIGSALRWDGRALACADGPELSLWALGHAGAEERWRRDQEVHEVVFVGKSELLGQGPRSPVPLRNLVADGSPVRDVTSLLTNASLRHSRAEGRLRGVRDGQELAEWREGSRRQLVSDAVPWVPLERQTWSPAEGLVGLTPLADGRDLQVRAHELLLTEQGGEAVERRWPLPAHVGRAVAHTVSDGGAHVLVRTDTGSAATLSLEEGRWSTWAALSLQTANNLAVSPDGSRAAACDAGVVRVWSVAAPELSVVIDGVWAEVAFVDPEHLVLSGPERIGMWRLDGMDPTARPVLDEPVRGLVWDELGLLAWGPSTALLWTGTREALPVPPVRSAAAAPDGEGLALAHGDAGLTLLRPGQPPRERAVDCELVAWSRPDELVCATREEGPVRVALGSGTVDRRDSLPVHRWHSLDARAGVVALMDWDTNFYELRPQGLTRRGTVPWANRAVLAGAGETLLLNGRAGLVPWSWRRTEAAPDLPAVPTPFRASAYAVSPGGDRVATALATGGLRIDAVDGTGPELIAAAGRPRASALAWSPDGRRLAVGLASGLVQLFDLSTPDCSAGTGPPGGDSRRR